MFAQKRSQRLNVEWVERPPFPREVFFDISNNCNHKCFFCSNHRISKKENLDTELLYKVLKECRDEGTTDIAFYATGEPFIRKDLAKIVRYAKQELGFPYIFIVTNGALATPERAKEVLDAGLDSVKFSVNAGSRETYKTVHGKDDFDKVLQHIKWFWDYRKTSGLKYGIYYSMVRTHVTEHEWPILQELLKPITDDDSMRSVSNQGGNMLSNNKTEKIDTKNLLGSLESNQAVKGRCPDPFFRATVTPQGFLTTCVVDYQNYLCMGDLRTHTLKDLWYSETFASFRKKHLEARLTGLICQNCLHNTNEPAEPIHPEFARPFDRPSREVAPSPTAGCS